LSLIFLAINANKFNSETLKKAINTKIKKITTARITQTHLAPELLNVENVHRENTAQIDKIIS
jgi:hypothetical protein